MKKGERGQHLLETGEWIPGLVDEETREEVKNETDDQIRERLKRVENFLDQDYVEYQDENWRDREDQEVVDSIVYLSYYMNVLEEREAFKKAMEIILKGKAVNLSENPTAETKGPDINDPLKKADK